MMKRIILLGVAVCALLLVGCGRDSTGTYLNSDWFVQKGVPTDSEGADGDLWLDTETTILYVKADGVWTNVGSLRGSDGLGWLFGTGEPSSSLGSDGDLYLDTASTNAYKKASGAWALLFTLGGTDGTNGTNGTDGTDGTVWFTDEGEPSSSDPTGAVVGDLYLDTETTKVYKKASSGAWTQIATLLAGEAQYAFTPFVLSTELSLYAVTQGKVEGTNTFVAVGAYGTVITSTDGRSWDFVAQPLFGVAPSRRGLVGEGGEVFSGDLYGVAYGNGVFVAVGAVDDLCSVYTSTDSVVWTPRTVTYAPGEGEPVTVTATLLGVTYAGGRFVATGYWNSEETAVILTSTDGSTWDVLVLGTVGEAYPWYLCSCAYSGSTYVAVDWNGYILTSTDGEAWSDATGNITDNSSPQLYSVSYQDGTFVAVGYDGYAGAPLILVSTDDGTTWTAQDVPLGSSCNLYGVTSGPGGFVAVGADWDSVDSIVLKSPNGLAWSAERWDYPLSSVCFGETSGGEALYVITRGNGVPYDEWIE